MTMFQFREDESGFASLAPAALLSCFALYCSALHFNYIIVAKCYLFVLSH